jgi:UDP-glucuronate decarboxylase
MEKDLPVSEISEIARLLEHHVQRFAGKNILITGGCGFLGYYFTELFVYLNDKVLDVPCNINIIDNLITADRDHALIGSVPHVMFKQHDIVQPLNWEEPLDYIIHAAGIASPFYYNKYPLETLDVATVGTRNVLQLAHKCGVISLLFFSSSEIYGDPDPQHVPSPETYRGHVSCTGPRACYDESKRLGETLCRIFHEHYGVPVRVVRPFNVYGPGMKETDYRVLPNFASRILNGQPVQVYGTGKQTRTFCYVTDAINGFLRTLLKGEPGEAYNIGNPRPEISMLDLAKELEVVIKRKVDIRVTEYPDSVPPDEPLRRCPDITKARQQLGYEPTVELPEGLRRFMDWAVRNYTCKVHPRPLR